MSRNGYALVTAILFIVCSTTHMVSQTATAPTGNGTSGDPYLIATLDNLYWITQNDDSWGSSFKQTADINASSSSGWDSGNGFSPIGNSSIRFMGTYDGDGHTISGLTIARGGTDYIGLFGASESAQIKNIGLLNENVTGEYIVGGIVGDNKLSVIEKSYSTGSVNSGLQDVGGLVGVNETSSQINNCYNIGSVNGSGGSVGGLAGNNYDSSEINSSYSIGNVQGGGFVGGLVGISQSYSRINQSYSAGSVNGSGTSIGGLVGANETSSMIDNCYSVASVHGTGYDVGGLVGLDVSSSEVNNSYSVGSVSSSADHVGGLTGYNDALLVTNSFWDTQTSGQPSSTGGTGETTAAMKDKSTFFNAGWDPGVWNIGDGINEGYPYLAWQHQGGTPLPVEVVSFAVASAGRTATLKWQTGTEVNNEGWEVERRGTASMEYGVGSSGIQWEDVGFVKGAGTSNSPKQYSFVDDNLSPGKYSYRLKQIDRSGVFKYSPEMTVGVGLAPREFTLSQNYPNPFNPTTTIEFTLEHDGRVVLKVYDILGREVSTLLDKDLKAGLYQQAVFDGSRFSSGVYFAVLQAGGKQLMKKMLLVK